MTEPTASADGPASAVPAVPGLSGGSAPAQPWPGELIHLDVGAVFVRATPAVPGAESAVYVHGLGGSALNWTDLMDHLSRPTVDGGAGSPGEHPQDGAQAPLARPRPLIAGHALDLPGFGFSPPPADGDYSLDARVAAVVALIEKRANWPVHLIGNSLGGAISTRLAARRPDLVRTLTLISPALPDLRPRLLPARLAVVAIPGVGRWLVDRLLAMTPEERADTSISELYAEPARMRPERRAEAIAEVRRRDELDYAVDALLRSTRALVREYARAGPGSLWHDAARVAAPTLLIHGSHDRLVNPAMVGRAARTFRNCRAVVLPRIGHVAMMERPDLVAAEMREFFFRVQAHPAGQLARSVATGAGPATAPTSAGRAALRPASN